MDGKSRKTDLDVLVVGAGIAGIGFAYHLQRMHPSYRFTIVEARRSIGGTWDLFRYPGVRSDVDMHLYGYSFNPWRGAKGVAPGGKIMDYLRDTIERTRLQDKVQLRTRVKRADWSSASTHWRVTLESTNDDGSDPATTTITCRWLQICTGYYSYERGYTPELPGLASFAGRVVHPQFWPEDLDIKGRQIVVIGSGATAVTLVPALAERGGTVTMLQRSPTYVFASGQEDKVGDLLRSLLPRRLAYRLVRWRKLLLDRINFRVLRWFPDYVKRQLRGEALKYLTDEQTYDAHFTPAYQIGSQRVCLVPRGDLFTAINNGSARVVTDRIERIGPSGIELASGAELPADTIVTATGLQLTMAAAIPLTVDGKAVHFSEKWIYRGIMFSGVPNLAITVGTFVSPYTLRVEMIGRWVAKVLRAMDQRGAAVAVPELPLSPEKMPARPFTTEYSSGYILRAVADFPKQGDAAPWINPQSYGASRRCFAASLDDGHLRFKSKQS